MTQLVLNIEQPAILPSLRKVLSHIEGVSIARPIRRARKALAKKAAPTTASTAEVTPELMAKIEQARADFKSGNIAFRGTAKEAMAWMESL